MSSCDVWRLLSNASEIPIGDEDAKNLGMKNARMCDKNSDIHLAFLCNIGHFMHLEISLGDCLDAPFFNMSQSS
jgi:hypothetical protein